MIQNTDNKLYAVCKGFINSVDDVEYSEALEFLSDIESLEIIESVTINDNRVEIVSNGSIGNVFISSNNHFKSIKIAINVFYAKIYFFC